ncbi:hypothetical protein SKC37_02885 [Aquirufa sp. HETE-83D]|uniref:Uncharacterized protein n=1 Tax=Aquirufa esocilacus TaxID=3096513 RepID=A0ABW6DIM6_9BACT
MKSHKIFLLFALVFFLLTFHSNAQIGRFVKSTEFKVFKNEVSNFKMGESYNGDFWFKDFDLDQVNQTNNENNISWGAEDVSFILLVNSQYAIIAYSNTMGGAGQSLFFDRKTKKITLYQFVAQELTSYNKLKCYRTSVSFTGPKRGRWWQSGILDLSTLKITWGAKDY